MLMIRLQRTGRKHVPSFRVVLTDKRNSTKSGKTLETLGFFNAENDKERSVNAERIKYWLSKGAQLSDTIHNFLIEQKIIAGKKINVLPKKRPIKPGPTESSPDKTVGTSGKEAKEEKPEEKSLGGFASKSPEEAPAPIPTETSATKNSIQKI
ncbi:MAG TPA: 30S ribosomal protein S16 [Candidatus Paceibacterota bacterium]